LGRAARSGNPVPLALRECADGRAAIADLPRIIGAARLPDEIVAADPARTGGYRDHADGGANRARLRVRPALSRFSVCLADHVRGAVRKLDAAQPAQAGAAADLGG